LKKWISVLVIVVILGSAGYVLRNRWITAHQEADPPYSIALSERRDIAVTVSGSGLVRESSTAQVRPMVSGYVQQLHCEQGSRVEKGQLLAVLSNDDLYTALDQARLDLAEARDKLGALESPGTSPTDEANVAAARLKVEKAELDLAACEADLAKLRLTAPMDGRVTTVDAMIGENVASNTLVVSLADDSALQVEVAVPEADMRDIVPDTRATLRLWSLHDPDSSSMTEYTAQGRVSAISSDSRLDGGVRVYDVTVSLSEWPEAMRVGMAAHTGFHLPEGERYWVEGGVVRPRCEAQVRAEVAGTVCSLPVEEGDWVQRGQLVAELASDVLQRQVDQARLSLAQARLDLDRLLVVDPAQVDIQRARVSLLESKVAGYLEDIENLNIYAPQSGLITQLLVALEDPVTGGGVMAEIADDGQLVVEVDVDELDIARVEPGQEAVVFFDALPGQEFAGTVTCISPVPEVKDGMSTYQVDIDIDRPALLRPGMSASADIVLEGRDDVVVVPLSAVLERSGKTVVRVARDERLTQVQVTTGLRTDAWVEILSGLEPGTPVVTSIYRGGSSPNDPDSGPGGRPQMPFMRMPGGTRR